MDFLKFLSENRNWRTALLVISIGSLYALPHLYENTLIVGLGFALILSLSSRPLPIKADIQKRFAYALISLGTYFILFQDQPWEFLFERFIDDLPSRLPIALCSVIMSVAGSGFLLRGKKPKGWYVLITLAIQLPLCHYYDIAFVKDSLREIGNILLYTDKYSGDMQAWQFIWLLNYYLPVYFFSTNRKKKEISEKTPAGE